MLHMDQSSGLAPRMGISTDLTAADNTISSSFWPNLRLVFHAIREAETNSNGISQILS